MDKVAHFSFRSIICHIAGDTATAKKYEELALREYDNHKNLSRVEDHVPRKTKKKLYEMVS